MAERRMFAKTIIDSDAFLDMPLSAQALYFHLSMRADDDGFVNNPRKIQRMIGANDDDIKLLIAKQFIIPFDSGIVVIKHWKIHNYIQKDRYRPTSYKEERAMLSLEGNGVYTECIHNVSDSETQVRLGKVSIGKDRLEIGESAEPDGSALSPEKPIFHKFGEYKHVKLTDEQYSKLIADYGEARISEYIRKVDEYCQQNGKNYKDYMDEMYNKSVSEGKDVGEAAAAAISYGMEKGLDEGKLKTAIEKFLQKADIEKALNHKDDDNWYYNQLEKMVDSLEKGSELHDDYYLKLIEGQNKVADNDSKATDKETENAKKKAEELAKLESKYQSSFGSVFTRNETNGVNGSACTPYIDTEKMEKTIAAKEKLTGYLEQLAQRGMPQSVINDLLAMDPIKAVEYARILLKVPNKFETVKGLAERDQAAAKKLAVISSIGSSEEFTNAGKVAGTNFSTGFISTVGNLLQTALPNLSGLTVNVGRSETIQSESTKPPAETMNYQSNTERRLENVTILLETIATMMNDSANKKTTLSFNPTIETVVTMDGETIAKKVTQKQEEYQIRTST